MGRRRRARVCPRGGEDVQALRESRTRLAAGVAAVAFAVALATLPLARADEAAFGEVGFRVAALALLALVGALVLGWAPLIPASLVLLGGLYGAQLAIDDAPLDGIAALFATGLLVTAELGYWSLEERGAVKAEPGEGLRRAAFVSALALCAVLVAELLLVLVEGVRAGGLAVDLLGAVAAGAVLLLVVVIARRAAPRGETPPLESRMPRRGDDSSATGTDLTRQ